MKSPRLSPLAAPRLFAGLGLAALLGAVGLVSSRPAHTAGGPIAVSVANTPLLATLTEPAAPTQPFQHQFQPTSSGTGAEESIVVPAHKRLVIEYVSASLNRYAPGVGGTAYLITHAGGETVFYTTVSRTQDGNKRSQSVKIYADPGTTVTVGALSNDFVTPEIGTDTEVSGYLVDVP